jgi:Do/DeqQ family serine protease
MRVKSTVQIKLLTLCMLILMSYGATATKALSQTQAKIHDSTQVSEEIITKLDVQPGNKNMFFSANLIADVSEAVSPSVVSIEVENVQEITVNQQGLPFNNEFFKRFFGIEPNFEAPQNKTYEKKSRGNGSGVIVSNDGYILTNNHVVKSASNIKVILNDSRKLDAKVVGSDAFSDIAVLKINADNLKPAKLGNSGTLRPGEWALAIGSPLGYDHTVTLGIISALSRQISNANVEFIQTDAAINPGNSGGPLVNLEGEVVGINTAIAGIGTSIGFAIPINVAKEVSEELIAKGFIERPWVGIAMKELDEQIVKSLGLLPNTDGVIVVQVYPNSPATVAGLQPGDIIQRINGEKIQSSERVQEIVRNKKINSELNIQALRDGRLVALKLMTGQWPGSTQNSKS